MPRFASLDEFYASLPEDQERAIRRFVDFVATTYPSLDLVLAWNQPMFKSGTKYLIGFMPTKNYINLATMSPQAVTHFAKELAGYRHGTRTVSLPFDWEIDADLIASILQFNATELGVEL